MGLEKNVITGYNIHEACLQQRASRKPFGFTYRMACAQRGFRGNLGNDAGQEPSNHLPPTLR